jgi:hypothetical protein
MTLEFLDPNTYTFAGGLPVKSGRDLIIPDSIVLSQTMLIKWQIRQLVKGATIEQIPPATLSAVLEIPGMGVLDRSDSEIQASQQGKDVVQIWTIDPSLPYKITFSGVSDLVANSVLEFYSSSLSMAEISNPASGAVDLSAVTAAITAASATEVAATQALQAATAKKVTRIAESVYNATQWSNAPGAHMAIPPDPNAIAIVLLNTSNRPVYWDLFYDINAKTPAPQYDNVMPAGGSIRIKEEEASAGVLLYTIGGSAAVATVNVNVEK